MRNAVSVQKIRKNFGEVEAVRDVSFEVYPGEIFGMLGPNGAGKTTSIRIMLDIFKANGGQVSIFGGDRDDAYPRCRIFYGSVDTLESDFKQAHSSVSLSEQSDSLQRLQSR